MGNSLNDDGQTSIEIPKELLIEDFSDPLEALMDVVFPNFLDHYNDLEFLKDRVILTPAYQNSHVHCMGTALVFKKTIS